MRILLVEDDPALSLGISRALRREGWRVDPVGDTVAAQRAVFDFSYDLIVLDRRLPGRDGVDLLRQWRAAGLRLPVMVLTAQGDAADRVDGLQAGADDYLCKPFDLQELLARLHVLQRRAAGRVVNRLDIGDVTVDLREHSVLHGEALIHLTRTEQAVLELLALHAGRLVPKERIVTALSSWDSHFSESLVEVYVFRLRRRLAGTSARIVTLRGFGYMLTGGRAPDAGDVETPGQHGHPVVCAEEVAPVSG
jgi:DNA-binding response OmpR family regulator